MKINVYLLLAALLFTFVVQAQDNIEGVWKSEKGDYMIKISSMGSKYQARIVWMENETDENGQQKLDRKNPEEKFRKLPIKGSKIINDLNYNPQTRTWEEGSLYIPDEGKTYNCQARISGSKLILSYGSKTWIWTRQS